MRHVLVGIELVVEVIAVEDQNTFEGLELKGKTAAKALRLDPDVVRYVAGDFGDEGIVNLGVKSRQSSTLKMIMDSSVIILRIVFKFRRIAFSRANMHGVVRCVPG